MIEEEEKEVDEGNWLTTKMLSERCNLATVKLLVNQFTIKKVSY